MDTSDQLSSVAALDDSPSSLLPPEVWLHVFGFLPTADRNNVRASCKHFRDLVDQPSLWRDFTVVLRQAREASPSFFSSNTTSPQYWAVLSRRNICSVLMQGATEGTLEQAARSLPNLTRLDLDQCLEESLCCLQRFPKLKRLAVRSSRTLLLPSSLLPLGQLTHLSVCNVQVHSNRDLLQAVSQLTNLTSLLLHYALPQTVPTEKLRAALGCLPQLKHLSVSLHMSDSLSLPENFFCPSSTLSSLEVLDRSVTIVTEKSLRGLSSLRSLRVQHLMSLMSCMPFAFLLVNGCHMRTWLKVAHRLTALHIYRGPPLGFYADSIPATVTDLTLVSMRLEGMDLGALAVRVPGLLHLHLDPHEDVRLSRLPQLLPQLRTLKIRYHRAMDSDFLMLHQLQHLQRLEILEARCRPEPESQESSRLSDLIRQLRILSDHRIQIVTSERQTDSLTCLCF